MFIVCISTSYSHSNCLLCLAKKASKFREWLDCSSLDVKPNAMSMEILSYLAYETVAQWAAVRLSTKSHCASDSQKPQPVSFQEVTLTFAKLPLYFHSVSVSSAINPENSSFEAFQCFLSSSFSMMFPGINIIILFFISSAITHKLIWFYILGCWPCPVWLNKIWLPKQAIRFKHAISATFIQYCNSSAGGKQHFLVLLFWVISVVIVN